MIVKTLKKIATSMCSYSKNLVMQCALTFPRLFKSYSNTIMCRYYSQIKKHQYFYAEHRLCFEHCRISSIRSSIPFISCGIFNNVLQIHYFRAIGFFRLFICVQNKRSSSTSKRELLNRTRR